MEFLPARQQYSSELGQGQDYVRLLPDRLTLRKRYTAKRFDQRRQTVFKEVQRVPLGDLLSPQARQALNTKPSRAESLSQLLSKIRQNLREIVLHTWKPDMQHVVLHSSGLDSRILSWTIRNIYEERGTEWLGDVVFLCSKWEGPEFKKIMRHEGWNAAQYWVVNEDVDPQHYYASSLLDFENIWQECAISAIPVNLFWYPIREAQRAGVLGNRPLQVYNAQWGNTVADYGACQNAAQAVKETWKKFYWSVLFERPMAGNEVIRPFACLDLVYTIMSSCVRPGKQLRKMIVQSMDTKLAEFVNMNSDGDRHRRIADDIINAMLHNYRQSWYAQYLPDMGIKHKTTEFQSAWSRYTTASLCEHLRNKGHHVTVVDE